MESERPGEAKELGRRVTGYDDLVWNANKYDIVKLGNIHKFNQDHLLRDFLLSSPNRVLVEASPVGRIRGVGLAGDSKNIDMPDKWPGLNLLGFALMEVRDFFLMFETVGDTSKMLPPQWIQFPEIEPGDRLWSEGKERNLWLLLFKKYNSLTREQAWITS